MSKNIKVVVLYRVLQEWRRPIFERIAKREDIDFTLMHGPDFKGSKVVSSKKEVFFKKHKLFSLKIRKESKNGLIAMPISIFLFFKLVLHRPDVVVSEGASNLFNATLGWIYCKIFGKKFIWWSLGKLKGTEHVGFRKKLDNWINKIERSSNAIISYSSLGKTYFKSIGVAEDKIFVAVNVVDTDAKFQLFENLKSEVKKIDSDFNVLFVGAMTPQKNLKMLIEAFAVLEQKRQNCFLTIVGGGSEMKKLTSLSESLNIKNIEFTGSVFDGVAKYFMKGDVFVLPGLGGLAVSEAMAFGVPVIASVGDGCEKDLVVNDLNGIIDESLTVNSLTEHLIKLYDSPEKLKMFQKNAQDQIRNRFNINTYIEEVINAIQYTQS